MRRKKLISIVIPVYNESLVIPELIKRVTGFMNKLKPYSFETILVENGSHDNSFSLLAKFAKKDRRLKIVQLSKNIGGEGGIEAGIHYAKGDALVIMMADLQEPFEIIEKFIKKWESGYEIVYGVINKRTAGIIRNFSSIVFYKIINFLTNNMFPENASDFRLIDKKVYTVINSMEERNKYLRGVIAWTGFKQIGIAFDRQKRFAGQSKTDFITVLKIALNSLFSFSYIPLRLISILGALITIASFLLILFYFYLFLIYGRQTSGIMTVIVLLLFLFGMLFFILGILSEYIARIYDEAKKRPIFIEKNKVNL